MAHKASRRNALADLRRRFRAALVYRRSTAQEFARREGVTSQHFSLVLLGKRESPRLMTAVLRYIAEFEQQVIREAGQPPAPKIQQPLAA